MKYSKVDREALKAALAQALDDAESAGPKVILASICALNRQLKYQKEILEA